VQLVIGGSRPDSVREVAAAVAAAGHAVDGICHRLDVTPIVVQAMSPQLCLLVARGGDGGIRDAATSVQRCSPGSFVLLLTDAAPADVWAAIDEEILDGIVSMSRPPADLDKAIRATAAGSRCVVGFLRPPSPGTAVAASPSVKRRTIRSGWPDPRAENRDTFLKTVNARHTRPLPFRPWGRCC
jgi:DNA-binding NarL/FixJ family response regulator